ncbi:MAG: nitrogenase-stabilizing/protective protein NifW [Polyangiaceae bacterium]|jgi:nitrogenase-stabilizing/protective protein
MAILAELNRLSTAEDFFRYLEVDYEADALAPARLRILRRFGEYLESHSLEGLDDASARSECRALLRAAHDDVLGQSARGERSAEEMQGIAHPSAHGLIPVSALSRGRPSPRARDGHLPK